MDEREQCSRDRSVAFEICSCGGRTGKAMILAWGEPPAAGVTDVEKVFDDLRAEIDLDPSFFNESLPARGTLREVIVEARDQGLFMPDP